MKTKSLLKMTSIRSIEDFEMVSERIEEIKVSMENSLPKEIRKEWEHLVNLMIGKDEEIWEL